MENFSKSTSISNTLKSLSPFERIIVGTLLILILISTTYLAYKANSEVLVEIPRQGGTYSEGLVGTPRFINPLLAISRADHDLSSIVYAGLLTRDAKGKLIPELAESYTISEDARVYTFILKNNLTFHDKTHLTAEDVVFTVKQAANASVRSPLFANWDGVQVEKVDDRTIQFTLPEPYAPFLDNLTLGILPAHIWSGLTAEEFPFSQFNITPVGSGPYRVKEVKRDKSGIPVSYSLTRFEEYALSKPYIDTLVFNLYNSEEEALEAFTKGDIIALSNITPSLLENFLTTNPALETSVYRVPLLRIFGVFFNHNKQPLFLKDEVRKALSLTAPKEKILSEIFHGYATPLSSPLPLRSSGTTTQDLNNPETISEVLSIEARRSQAKEVLEEEDWKMGEETHIYSLEEKEGEEAIPLSFTLSTVNTPELSETATILQNSWNELGAQVDVKLFESTDLTQTVLRPRRFDALLFGMVVGHEYDLYAFWHSSQRNDPGLNIAQFADIEADALLEKMRTERDEEAKKTLYSDFAKLVESKDAAIFLYSPDFIFLVRDSVHNVSLHPISDTSERFDTIHTWNMETDTVWAFLRDFFE